MEKLKNKLTLIVILGIILLLGPFLDMESMGTLNALHIPIGHLFIYISWLGIIVLTGLAIQKSKW